MLEKFKILTFVFNGQQSYVIHNEVIFQLIWIVWGSENAICVLQRVLYVPMRV